MNRRESVRGFPAERAAGDTDLDLIRTGDAAAFERMFRAHAAALCDFALSYLRTREGAEEIVQDLFCWIWEHRFTIDVPHGVRAWLFTAVRNRSLNALRDARAEFSMHERVSRADAAKGGPVAPDAEFAARDLADRAEEIIDAMPPRCREAFTLVRRQQLSYAEAAQVMGVSARTVEVHMTRAMTLLRAGLREWTHPDD